MKNCIMEFCDNTITVPVFEKIETEIKTPYDIKTEKVVYSNDFEYRSCLRKLFCMKAAEESDADDDLDEITRDEQDFDEEKTTKALDFIYDNTQKNPAFQKLYDWGAEKMLSLDRSIGLSVLCSYDYLGAFHYCLYCYFSDPNAFSEEHVAFVELKNKLN